MPAVESVLVGVEQGSQPLSAVLGALADGQGSHQGLSAHVSIDGQQQNMLVAPSLTRACQRDRQLRAGYHADVRGARMSGPADR